MVTVDVVVMMATGARGPVWVDREAQRRNVSGVRRCLMPSIDAAAGHCNEWVGHV